MTKNNNTNNKINQTNDNKTLITRTTIPFSECRNQRNVKVAIELTVSVVVDVVLVVDFVVLVVVVFDVCCCLFSVYCCYSCYFRIYSCYYSFVLIIVLKISNESKLK